MRGRAVSAVSCRGLANFRLDIRVRVLPQSLPPIARGSRRPDPSSNDVGPPLRVRDAAQDVADMTEKERLDLVRMLSSLAERESDPQISATLARLAAFYAGKPEETKH